LAASLAGCTSLPSRTGLRLPPPSNEPLGPITYPNLSDIPDLPLPLTSEAERQAIIGSLLADRALTAQAAESLRREIETNFVVPEPPAGL
jgi:hypothetical protein